LALPRLLAGSGALRAQIQARVADNRQTLEAALTGDLPGHALPAEGGWYAIVRLPAAHSEDAWALALLDRHNVLAQPGYFYDLPVPPPPVRSRVPPPPHVAARVARLAHLLRDA
jgi:aspartate/methionine/tyrosine aminotransferase